MGRYPQRQRVAAYAVVIRDEQILLSRLAPHIAGGELWALPGGGLDHGEDPVDAVVREIYEETGLHASVSREARVYSMHNPRAHHGDGRRGLPRAAHRLRRLGAGRLARAAGGRGGRVHGRRRLAPAGRRRSGKVPVTDLVHQALRGHAAFQMQRLAAYALVRARRHRAADADLRPRPPARHLDAARWRHRPRREARRRAAPRGPRGVRRRLRGRRSCSASTTCTSPAPPRPVGTRTSTASTWSSPPTVGPTPSPGVLEVGGTTDAVAWVPVADVETGAGRRPRRGHPCTDPVTPR